MDKTFVSRGGTKLQAALTEFKIDVTGLVVLDVGSSTGGFVDCLLQNGASKVYSVDTAYGELAWKLRNDPRVIVMERTNILYLENLPEQVEDPEHSRRIDIITIDASWTKLELILPVVSKFLKSDGQIVALLKPHYQTQKRDLVKGVVPEVLVESIKDQVLRNIQELGFDIAKQMESPILGGGGNKEYLLLIKPA